jgi:hypothetical protein
MKTNKYLFTAVTFFTGMVVGVSIIGLFAFTVAPAASSPGGGLVAISAAQAHAYSLKFRSTAAPLNQVVKGFTIDKAQLEAMNSLVRENTALSGFRIYMGMDDNSKKLGIVVGIDNMGRDAVANTIYNTDAQNVGPCPPICDVSSPIVLDR